MSSATLHCHAGLACSSAAAFLEVASAWGVAQLVPGNGLPVNFNNVEGCSA
jgi:hypothetical protein